jgi:putative ubiquitin-RnfH superfamily antitoxin RatB of RatAB toxin-antitoxin module
VSEEPGEIVVEVAYARPDVQRIVQLRVPEGTTLQEALERSAITEHFPEIDLASAAVGVFGKVEKKRDRVLREWDRVEIYRPLEIDPRARRAERAKAAKDGG